MRKIASSSVFCRLAVLGLWAMVFTACGSVQSGGVDSGHGVPESDTQDSSLHNTVRWTTASELENFGFQVYRSSSEDGPFERLNEEIIEGGGTVDTPRRYEFVDTTNDPCEPYYYYVESVSLSGQREVFTPVIRAGAKLGAEDSRCPGSE